MIELRDVVKRYNAGRASEFTALRGVSLTLAAGRVTVLTGPSGSGKTTLLSLVGCMARPTSGRIHVFGQEVTSLPERFLSDVRRGTFGFIFQSLNLIRGLTVLENVMIPAYPTGERHGALKARAVELLDSLGVAGKAPRRVEELSGGEQQRVAMARALVNRPAVIIADEPTAHLDSAMTREFMAVMADLNASGKTVVIASHDPLVFESPAVHRVVALRDGGLVPGGAP